MDLHIFNTTHFGRIEFRGTLSDAYDYLFQKTGITYDKMFKSLNDPERPWAKVYDRDVIKSIQCVPEESIGYFLENRDFLDSVLG